MLPSPRDSRGPSSRDGKESNLRTPAPGGCLSSAPFRPIPSITGSDFPGASSARCPSPPPFQPLLRRGATFRTTAPDDARRLRPSDRFPRGLRPSVHRLQADARHRRASERSPEGARSSTQRVGADALHHCPLDRFRSDVVADVRIVTIALPLAAARIRDELEVASPRSSLRPPAAPPPRRRACAPRRLDCVANSARVASDPHRALEATGCYGPPPPSTLACARDATPAQVPT
jgi:hypothetical protein